MMVETSFDERLVDPITRWKVLLSQLELSKNRNSPKLKWKIGATKSRYSIV